MAGLTFQDVGACGCVAAGVVCVTCTPASIPFNLFISDAVGGPYTAAWDGTSKWITPMLCSGSVSPVADCPGAAVCHFPTQSAGAAYLYQILCAGTNVLSIQRVWWVFACTGIHTGQVQYLPCGCPIAGSQGTAAASPTITCGSISWSGTLGTVSGLLADPVGGTTSFTQ